MSLFHCPFSDKLSIQFLGAANTVTGSKTLISAGEINILVDYGMFQGLKHQRELNWLSGLKNKPEYVFINHGELQSSNAPRIKIQDIYGWNAVVPQIEDKFLL